MPTTFPMSNPWTDGEGLDAAAMQARVTTPLNDLAATRAFAGSASGTTDATGYATITHGLAFTPSLVLAVSNNSVGPSSRASIVFAIDTKTSTTFRVRFLTIAAATGGNFYVLPAATLPFSIDWTAWR